MRTGDLDYHLPPELIAQHPAARRDASRLLVVDRASGTMQTGVYANVAQHLRRGDCMVLNDTRVIRARLRAHKPTGGAVELFLLHEEAPALWRALVRPSARVKPGTRVALAGGIEATVEGHAPEGRRLVRFDRPGVLELLEAIGEIPLPPYIHRNAPEAGDLERYQTVYAAQPGAVAAPTAGLHLSGDVFRSLDAAGVARATLTLHVGYGTFKPMTADTLDAHSVDGEDYVFPEAAAAQLDAVRAAGGRVVAVGTTAARVLETCHDGTAFRPGAGVTNAYLYPPYVFRGVDALQTNFHLPRTSLLALVCAFAGLELTRAAYDFAIRERFRFYSYGDAMLIV